MCLLPVTVSGNSVMYMAIAGYLRFGAVSAVRKSISGGKLYQKRQIILKCLQKNRLIKK